MGADKTVKLAMRRSERVEAARWVARLDCAPLSEAEELELKAWLTADAARADEFYRLQDCWSALDALEQIQRLEISHQSKSIETSPKTRWRVILAAAASFVFVVVGAGLLNVLNPHNGRNIVAVYESAFGQQKTISLPDGSVVTLNTDSELTSDYSADLRRIDLHRGEAYFAVEKNAKRPFSVYAGGSVVRAVGTAFTVRLRSENDIEVTVEEGSVSLREELSIQSSNHVSALAPAASQTLLDAGKNVVFGDGRAQQIAVLQGPELARKLSWRRGLLSFSGEPLIDVLREIGRYSKTEFVVEDPAISALPIGGHFRVGEVDSFLRALDSTFNIRSTAIDEQRVLLYRDS